MTISYNAFDVFTQLYTMRLLLEIYLGTHYPDKYEYKWADEYECNRLFVKGENKPIELHFEFLNEIDLEKDTSFDIYYSYANTLTDKLCEIDLSKFNFFAAQLPKAYAEAIKEFK